MLTRIFAAAVFAGMLGGLAVTAMQMMQVVPLILKAESYESAASVSLGHDHGHEHAQPHDHDAANDNAAGSPDDDPLAAFGGSDRTLITLLVNLVMATGFALLLCAAFALRGDGDARKGLLWGAAGFLVFNLAPALGLPPELPGAYAAPLFERQTWWLGTAVASCIGLAVIAFGKSHAWRAAGILLLVIPHAIGAPHLDADAAGSAPPELAAHYIMVTLFASAIMWSLLGLTAAYVYDRLTQDQTATLAEPHAT